MAEAARSGGGVRSRLPGHVGKRAFRAVIVCEECRVGQPRRDVPIAQPAAVRRRFINVLERVFTAGIWGSMADYFSAAGASYCARLAGLLSREGTGWPGPAAGLARPAGRGRPGWAPTGRGDYSRVRWRPPAADGTTNGHPPRPGRYSACICLITHSDAGPISAGPAPGRAGIAAGRQPFGLDARLCVGRVVIRSCLVRKLGFLPLFNC